MFFSPEIRARRARLRAAYAAMDAHQDAEWRKATEGTKWWRKIRVELDETERFEELHREVDRAHKELSGWQRWDLWLRRTA